MFKIYVIIIPLLISFITKADGDYMVEAEFMVSLVNGKHNIGYVETTGGKLIRDSLQNTEFLKRALTVKFRNRESDIIDTLVFYSNRFMYTYLSSSGENRIMDTVSALFNRTAIAFNDIEKIKFIKLRVINAYFINAMKLSDTVWCRTKLLQSVNIIGLLCEFELFVHETNPNVSSIIAKLKEKSKQHQQKFQSTELSYEELYVMDEKLRALINKLSGEKTVAVQYCSD